VLCCRAVTDETVAPRSWLVGTVLGLAFLLLYLLTLCPTVFWYDSAEYATAAATLGIPHPPGYPLYTLIGWLVTRLPAPEPAYAANLMSALAGALGVGLCFAVARRLGASHLAAAVGSLSLGACQLYWSQCLIAEVYSPGLCFLLGVLLLLLRGLERNHAGLLVLAAGLAGLGLGMHLFIATCGLGFALLVLGLGLPIARPRDLGLVLSRAQLRRRLAVAAVCAGATLLGSCIFLYIPLRASMGPELNFENPSTWDRFAWFVTGGNYKNWFMQDYALWPRALRVIDIFYDQLLPVGLALALAGLLRLARARPLQAVALLLMATGNIYLFFNYSVHDLEVFFLPAVAVLFVLVAYGAQAAIEWIDRRAPRRALLRAAARVVLALYPLSLGVANYRVVDLSRYTAAREFGERLCTLLPAGAVVLNFTTPPEWKNNAVFANYFQIVLRRRRDVAVVTPGSPIDVLRILGEGKRVFAYYPLPRIRRLFELERHGPLYRLTRPLPRRR